MKQENYQELTLEERERIARYVDSGKYFKRATKNVWSILFSITVLIFAFAGFSFIAAYVGVNLHLTDTEGIVDRQSDGFWSDDVYASVLVNTQSQDTDSFFNQENLCSLKGLKAEYSGTFWRILDLALDGKKELAQSNLDVAIRNQKMGANSQTACGQVSHVVSQKDFELLAGIVDDKPLYLFASSSEWSLFKTGVLKDVEIISRVEKETGIKGRILVSQLVAEQLRLYYSDRAWFEKAIEPVKVLASMSQFSWGVLGIKQDTAIRVEQNLKNKNSVFYPGPDYENMLDFKTADHESERFKRITSYKDHYYGYLYAALFNRQIIAQWQKSDFDISDRPEILATIYNIGFNSSKPNSNPQMGGAELNIEGNRYSFGRLAHEFYYSGELLDEFPQ